MASSSLFNILQVNSCHALVPVTRRHHTTLGKSTLALHGSGNGVALYLRNLPAMLCLHNF